MATAMRCLVVGPILLAGGALGCGRSDLRLAAAAGAGGSSPQTQAADVAWLPDVAPLSGPDLVPPSLPDLAPPSSPDLAPDLRSPLCGNGRVDLDEECDDGNTLPGDGCDARCRLECNFTPCDWPPLTLPVVCGDGVLGSGEACDDRNTESGDGCAGDCTIEPGFHCLVPGRHCTPICGDGRVVGTETCDDGNQTSGDGCSEFCLTEDCWDCSSGACRPRPPVVDGGNCHGLPTARCGDGKLQGAEECDDGPDNSDTNYGGCTIHCRYLRCGDGMVSGPEECDLGSARNTTAYGDPDGCTSVCTRPHYCGDGYVDADYGEECDNGPLNGLSMCLPGCRIYLP